MMVGLLVISSSRLARRAKLAAIWPIEQPAEGPRRPRHGGVAGAVFVVK